MAKITVKNQTGDTSLPLVIVNPKSASGSTRDKWSATASDLRAHFGPFSVAFTKGPGDGIELAERAANSGRQFIIACGGDGTINEVANGILRSGVDVELGVLPSGTGGDFRRTLGLPLGNREAAAALRDGITRHIDAGRVTFIDHQGKTSSRYFLNVSSAGLAANIIERVKSQKVFDWLPVESLRGRANFAVSTLQQVLDLDPVMLNVRFDDGPASKLQTIAFCVANSRYFGGGMLIAPDASLNDGLLDVVNIGDIGALKIILNAHTLYRGTHHGLQEVNGSTAKRIEISAVDPSLDVRIETDGELPGRLPATYEIVPNAIRVRVPNTGNRKT
ncbi:MAG: diacylglycerol kinase family protein [Pyrinomonadaceae bacterium]|nr:diacylglycerol kinase family lipid kinase [Acidobacteriota bacterium]